MKNLLLGLFCLIETLASAQVTNLVIPVGHTGGLLNVGFSPDGKFIYTGSSDETVKFWSLNGRELQSFSGGEEHSTLSPDGKILLTCGGRHPRLWDLNGQVRQSFNESEVLTASFSPDSKLILMGFVRGDAKCLDLQGNVIYTFPDEGGTVAFSPNGKQVLISDYYDATSTLWDLNAKKIQSFKGSGSSLAFSPDGNLILMCSYPDATLWSLKGELLQTFKGHADETISIAFSPDGKSGVLTGSKDTTAKLWDLSGNLLQTFKGHADEINSVAFSPDGKFILTGSWDSTAKLWDLNGTLLQTFEILKGNNLPKYPIDDFGQPNPHAYDINAVDFSPDGMQILTGGNDKIARLWNLKGQVVKSMKADVNGDGQVTASEIQSYVADMVQNISGGFQVPTFRRENLEFDFRVW